VKGIIDVFRMKEIKPSTRIKIIETLGMAINRQDGTNITDDLVCELVKELEREIRIDKDIAKAIDDI